MEKYKVEGMSCAACSARVEKAVSAVEGVVSCSVNLLTNSMIVEGSASEETIIVAVEDAGYKASKEGQKKETSFDEETRNLKKRLIFSVLFLIVLMYFSMGKMLFGIEYFGIFKESPLAVGIVQMILSLAVMIINKKFFISGYKSLRHKSPNMDVLVSMGSLAAFIYSSCVLYMLADATLKGNHELMHEFSHGFYFESAAMIPTLITVGKMLESYSKGKTTNAIKSLMDLAPKTATVIRDGKEVVIKASEIVLGDIFILTPGKSVPADGAVIEGASSVDESALTGESMPVDKTLGDKVWQATINKAGYLKCRATGVGEETTLSKIIKLVSDAASTKAPISRIADKVSGVFVPVVVIIALITTFVWIILGKNIGFSLARGICVLVISCPCALGLATPVAIMVGTGKAAENGILIKSAEALETLGKATTVVFDKTGTLTSGQMSVSDIIVIDKSLTQNSFLTLCGAIEKESEHPLGEAIRRCAEELNLNLPEVSDFTAYQGKGVTATINSDSFIAGNKRFLVEQGIECNSLDNQLNDLSSEGKTPLIFAKNNDIIGIVALSDTIREDSINAIEGFKKLHKKTVMLTGDNGGAANFVGEKTGIDLIISDLLPADKEKQIRHLQENGEKVVFIGDGINDAPALTTADIGIAIGAGSDIAIDCADIVLINNSLADALKATELSISVMRNIKINLFWAFFYNCLGIPLASGVLFPLWGLKLTPMIGSAAMSLSSVSVVTNALRLKLFKSRLIKDVKTTIQEDTETQQKGFDNMEKTIKVEGMMCPRCEAHVVKALTSIDGVESATASHEENIAKVKLSKEIADDILIKAIVDEGYEASI